MSDPTLLRAAIEATGLPDCRFAAEVMNVNDRSVRRWLKGDRAFDGPAAVICKVIESDPSTVPAFRAAVSALRHPSNL